MSSRALRILIARVLEPALWTQNPRAAKARICLTVFVLVCAAKSLQVAGRSSRLVSRVRTLFRLHYFELTFGLARFGLC